MSNTRHPLNIQYTIYISNNKLVLILIYVTTFSLHAHQPEICTEVRSQKEGVPPEWRPISHDCWPMFKLLAAQHALAILRRHLKSLHKYSCINHGEEMVFII